MKTIKELKAEGNDMLNPDSGIHKGHWTYDDVIQAQLQQTNDIVKMMDDELNFWNSEQEPDEERKLQVAFLNEVLESFKQRLMGMAK